MTLKTRFITPRLTESSTARRIAAAHGCLSMMGTDM
eukprot:CAMPEP_0179110450 /NCGR_PEP_ID=MMETSP0796-20121207/51546_1 /TAXON_ID=73915 /ORGANISM="Pyrodinium bahamense, Strain pbaha01" /LENGTH=35 /DNA_ID= /DNA_START= /DNA_END= /DNA_ORIENTATION=